MNLRPADLASEGAGRSAAPKQALKAALLQKDMLPKKRTNLKKIQKQLVWNLVNGLRRCPEGFVGQEAMYVCLADGQLLGLLPRCAAQTCGVAPQISGADSSSCSGAPSKGETKRLFRVWGDEEGEVLRIGSELNMNERWLCCEGSEF